MAYTIVQHLRATQAASPYTATWPQSTASGNLLVAIIFARQNSLTITNAQGWVQIATRGGFTINSQCDLWAKFNSSAGEANPSFAGIGAIAGELEIMEVSGLVGGGALDVKGTNENSSVATLNVNINANTSAGAFCVGGCGDAEGATAGLTWSAPGGSNITGVIDIDHIDPPLSGNGLDVAWGVGPVVGLGANFTFTLSAATTTELVAVIGAFTNVAAPGGGVNATSTITAATCPA